MIVHDAAEWTARIIVDRWARAGLRWKGDPPAPSRDGQTPDIARSHVAMALMRGTQYVLDEHGIPQPNPKQ